MSKQAGTPENTISPSGLQQSDDQDGRSAVAQSRLVLALVGGWLVPGAGHLILGRRVRGLLFAAIVASAFLIGLQLQGRLPWTFDGSPLTSLASLGAAGSGLLFAIAKVLMGYEGVASAPGYEYGSAFILTAGLMNILLLLDVWDVGVGRKP